jgi:hypothetical protein
MWEVAKNVERSKWWVWNGKGDYIPTKLDEFWPNEITAILMCDLLNAEEEKETNGLGA